jgi:hypothetical protein
LKVREFAPAVGFTYNEARWRASEIKITGPLGVFPFGFVIATVAPWPPVQHKEADARIRKIEQTE